MTERIYKLQPDRTLSLRGFDTFAAAASIHNASPAGFEISGIFRDPADFAVAVLYDADNFFEHPSIKYLPDFDFSGLTLNFSLQYTDSVQPIDSPKYNWIGWATLDVIREDGSTANVSLWENATLADAAFPAASATVNVISGNYQTGDRLSLWYENLAFDFTVPNLLGSSTTFFFLDKGQTQSITVGANVYSYTVTTDGGEDGSTVARGIYNAASADPLVAFTVQDNVLSFKSKVNTGGTIVVVGYTLWLITGTPDASFFAGNIAAQINGYDWINANTVHGLLASTSGAAITVTAARYGSVNVSGTTVTWVLSTNSQGVKVAGAKFSGITPSSTIIIAGTPHVVASVQSPTQLTLTLPATAASAAPYLAPRGGRDGNMIQLYALASSPGTLAFDRSQIPLTGGSSAVTWNVSLDFTALGIDSIRQCWLTFAPALANGSAYTASEWQATFSNWQLMEADGTDSVKALQVAGPGSVRIEEDDEACAFTANWSLESGFYSKYFAKKASLLNESVAVTYTCQFTHNLYLGTSLSGTTVSGPGMVLVENTLYDPSANGKFYSDRGIVGIRLNTDTTETLLDCRVNTGGAELVARRLLRTNVPAGTHTVTIRVQQAGAVYFDFLEAAVLSDVPGALIPRGNISPALDFDTDHTYKLPPARLMWIMDKLGYAGPMNEYLGVFWWNQRVASGGSFSTAQVTFSGPFAENDSITLFFSVNNGTPLLKSVTSMDTPATIANHFAAYINSSLVGAWASATSAGVLTVTARSPAPAYNLVLSSPDAAKASVTPDPQPAGVYPDWIVDDSASPPINRAARDWHADFYSQCAARSREVVTACSMELVDPPAGYVARFPDGSPVATSTGFGSLVSNHCAIGSSKMIAYQKAVYRNIAQMQSTAGLTPSVQYGEFLWWFFERTIAVGFASYTSPISIGTAAPHGLSSGADVSISGVIGNDAANGSWVITVIDPTHFTLNGSSGSGAYISGGTVTVPGMAFYDDETAAAAQTALGRALHTFTTPNDDPLSVNSGQDATFLRNRLRDHLAALIADIRSAFPNVKCELLWPYDVNYPTPVGGNGGKLNRFINLPVEWQQQATSGLDSIKTEALAFATGLRNLDLARETIELFPSFGWPLSALRYLVPVFGVATPWERELALVWGAGLSLANLWAFDHICLFNLDVPERALERRSIVKSV